MATTNDKKITENPQKEKSTDELDEILESTHIRQIGKFLKENADSMRDEERPFTQYMREMIRGKKLKQQDVFLGADIPEKYGYKLISGEKRTKQRDVILRICYAARFSLAETQRALKMYDMPALYSKSRRDAVLMIAFNERPGKEIFDVDKLLMQYGMEPLRTVGAGSEE